MSEIPSNLIDDVKDYLNISWWDETTEKKITGIIQRGISYLDTVAGAKQDYSVEGKAKELLLEYCLYVRSNALASFQDNYLSELLTLQMQQEVKTYAENKNTDLQ